MGHSGLLCKHKPARCHHHQHPAMNTEHRRRCTSWVVQEINFTYKLAPPPTSQDLHSTPRGVRVPKINEQELQQYGYIRRAAEESCLPFKHHFTVYNFYNQHFNRPSSGPKNGPRQNSVERVARSTASGPPRASSYKHQDHAFCINVCDCMAHKTADDPSLFSYLILE